jgi:hypothetical protein
MKKPDKWKCSGNRREAMKIWHHGPSKSYIILIVSIIFLPEKTTRFYVDQHSDHLSSYLLPAAHLYAVACIKTDLSRICQSIKL